MSDQPTRAGYPADECSMIGSLCTGYGGLDRAVESVSGGCVAWVADNDPVVSSFIAARFAGVPNLGDISLIDWSAVASIDTLTAGYPCQPFSTAGRRQGANDERHLWPHVANAIRALRPRRVVLENVAGHVSLGLDAVLGDLAQLGFDAEWVVVRASDVGACHKRARVFIVAANTDGAARRCLGAGRGPRPLQRAEVDERAQVEPRRRSGSDRAESPVAPTDANLVGLPGGDQRRSVPGLGAPGREPPRAHPEVAWRRYQPAIDRHARALGRPAPPPVDERGRLSAHFVEWMQMLPAGWVTGLVTDRNQALRCLGNGVVPPQATHALTHLLKRSAA